MSLLLMVVMLFHSISITIIVIFSSSSMNRCTNPFGFAFCRLFSQIGLPAYHVYRFCNGYILSVYCICRGVCHIKYPIAPLSSGIPWIMECEFTWPWPFCLQYSALPETNSHDCPPLNGILPNTRGYALNNVP